MSQALSYINWTIGILVFLAGIYMVATEHNLLRKLMGVNISASGVLLFAVLTGFIRRGQRLADGNVAGVNSVVPPMQWLAVVGVLAVTIITVVGLVLARGHRRAFGTMDLEEKRNGTSSPLPEDEEAGE